MDHTATKGLTIATIFATFLIASATLQAAAVGISNVSTGDGLETNFGTVLTPSGTFGEIIGISVNSFAAISSTAFNLSLASDTIAMTLTAPTGYKITSIKYTETINAQTTQGISSISGSMAVNATPTNLPNIVFGPNSNSPNFDVPVLTLVPNLDVVNVIVTNVLSAISFNGSTASVTKTGAEIEVGLAAIPLPPAVWMMGAAIAALVTVSRRRA